MARCLLLSASCGVALALGCSGSVDEPTAITDPLDRADGQEGGCGGEAARGGYVKSGTEWDGSAGNPYGYPAALRPAEDCYGFGFHDTCRFYESCIYGCEQDSDCPTVTGDVPIPECRTPEPTQAPGVSFAEESVCVLPCDGDSGVEACPEGMSCVFHPYGFRYLCMWPR